MPLFQKGNPKTPGSGRKKGSKNLKKIPRVKDYLAEAGVNPAEMLLKLLPCLECADQAKVLMHLLGYVDFKARAVIEMPDPPKEEEDGTELSDEELEAIVRSAETGTPADLS